MTLKKSHMTSFYDVIKITSPKIRHQNDVTKFSIFKPLLQQNPDCAPVDSL